MARKGRAAERIVARLEKSLLPNGAEVRSPAFIPDKVTGSPREVDVAIRYKLGSVPILVIVECRDRKARADKTWIEQVALKKQDLNAAKAIAVSTSGFSRDARKKAAHHGVEVRVLSEITQEDVRDWLFTGGLHLFVRRSDVKRVRLVLGGRETPERLELDAETERRFRCLSKDDPLIHVKKTGEGVSARTIWSHAQNIEGVYDGVPQDGGRLEKVIELNYPDPAERYVLQLPTQVFDVEAVIFLVDLWVDQSIVPVERVLAYNSADQSLVRSVEYKVEAGRASFLVSFQREVETGITTLGLGKYPDPEEGCGRKGGAGELSGQSKRLSGRQRRRSLP